MSQKKIKITDLNEITPEQIKGGNNVPDEWAEQMANLSKTAAKTDIGYILVPYDTKHDNNSNLPMSVQGLKDMHVGAALSKFLANYLNENTDNVKQADSFMFALDNTVRTVLRNRAPEKYGNLTCDNLDARIKDMDKMTEEIDKVLGKLKDTGDIREALKDVKYDSDNYNMREYEAEDKLAEAITDYLDVMNSKSEHKLGYLFVTNPNVDTTNDVNMRENGVQEYVVSTDLKGPNLLATICLAFLDFCKTNHKDVEEALSVFAECVMRNNIDDLCDHVKTSSHRVYGKGDE